MARLRFFDLPVEAYPRRRPKGHSRESFAGKKASPLDGKRLATLKEFLANGMKLLETPGVGLAFLDGGKTIWAGGLGVKELGKPDAVGQDTLFLGASNAKAPTTLLLAELVNEGKMRWDQPVTELFPACRLGDEATTKQVLLEHLREWKSAVASRKNDDGTISFLRIDPTQSGFEFVVADKDAKRRLITRDAQHEYVFVEQAAAASTP